MLMSVIALVSTIQIMLKRFLLIFDNADFIPNCFVSQFAHIFLVFVSGLTRSRSLLFLYNVVTGSSRLHS